MNSFTIILGLACFATVYAYSYGHGESYGSRHDDFSTLGGGYEVAEHGGYDGEINVGGVYGNAHEEPYHGAALNFEVAQDGGHDGGYAVGHTVNFDGHGSHGGDGGHGGHGGDGGHGGHGGHGGDGGHGGHGGKGDHKDYYHHPSYKFEYGVTDHKTKDSHSHWEHRDGDKVHGEYTLDEADGTKRIVTYSSDKKTGFTAHVQRIGHATHEHGGHGHGGHGGDGGHGGHEGGHHEEQ